MPKNDKYNLLGILEEQEAFLKGHFRLADGRHSAVYINALALMEHTHIAKTIARLMSEKFGARVDVVLAPSKASFVIAEVVAATYGVRAAYMEGNALANNYIIRPEEAVLIVDDVAVSGAQIMRALVLARAAGARVTGVSVLVDRSDGELALNTPLRSLLQYPLLTYEPSACPLCTQNIPLENK